MTQQANRPGEVFAELRQQFEQWRSTQPLRSKLPESLWQSAANLAKEHGVNPTARALGLADKDTTIRDLRQLLVPQSTEKTREVLEKLGIAED